MQTKKVNNHRGIKAKKLASTSTKTLCFNITIKEPEYIPLSRDFTLLGMRGNAKQHVRLSLTLILILQLLDF